jgi:hypothetical protein
MKAKKRTGCAACSLIRCAEGHPLRSDSCDDARAKSVGKRRTTGLSGGPTPPTPFLPAHPHYAIIPAPIKQKKGARVRRRGTLITPYPPVPRTGPGVSRASRNQDCGFCLRAARRLNPASSPARAILRGSRRIHNEEGVHGYFDLVAGW